MTMDAGVDLVSAPDRATLRAAALSLMLLCLPALAAGQDVGTVPADNTPAVPEADNGPSRPFSEADIPKADTQALLSFYEVFASEDNARAQALKAAIASELDKRTPGWRGPASSSTTGSTVVSTASPASTTGGSSTGNQPSGTTPSTARTRTAAKASSTGSTEGGGTAGNGTTWQTLSATNASRFWLSVPEGDSSRGPRWIWDPITGKRVELEEHTKKVGVVQAAEDELANTDRSGAVMRPLKEK